MEIQRFDKRPGCSRVVIHNHVAYFTGHVAAGKQPTLREQGEAVLKRYDELFERFGLKKRIFCTQTLMCRIYQNIKKSLNPFLMSGAVPRMPLLALPFKPCVPIQIICLNLR